MKSLIFIFALGLSTASLSQNVFAYATGEQKSFTYTVTGMTCGECSKKVKAALQKLDGVQSVEVDHVSGKTVVQLSSASKTNDAAIRSAIEKEGYKIKG
jgi:copper chaperone CopZ